MSTFFLTVSKINQTVTRVCYEPWFFFCVATITPLYAAHHQIVVLVLSNQHKDEQQNQGKLVFLKKKSKIVYFSHDQVMD